MLRVLFFSDLHASMKHGLHGIAFVEQVEKTLDWIVEMATLHDVDYVVFLGDVFHVQQAADTPSIHTVSKGFEKIQRSANVQFVIIEGNHDVYLKDGVWSSTEIMRHMRKEITTLPIVLVSKHETLQLHDKTFMQCIAYTEKGYTQNPEAHFIVGHLEVNGAMFRPGGLVEDHGVSPMFESFQPKEPGDLPIHYIGGHYHHPQIIGHSLFPGSCCYHSYQDLIVETPRGAVLLQLDRPRTPVVQDFTWIENPHATPTHTVHAKTHADAEDQIKALQNHCHVDPSQWNVRTFLPTAELEHLDKRRIPDGVNLSTVPDDPPKVVARTKITSKTSPTEAFDEYMKQVPPHKMADAIQKEAHRVLLDVQKQQVATQADADKG